MVSHQTIVHDTISFLRDKLASNITDPNSAQHTGNNKFVMTSYPDRKTIYPVIIIDVTNFSDQPVGLGSENRITTIEFQIDIWGRTAQERDTLQDAVYHFLRGYQTGSGEAVLAEKLLNFNIGSAVHVDEEGINQPHRSIITGTYQHITEA
jgi:hypothetical protein